MGTGHGSWLAPRRAGVTLVVAGLVLAACGGAVRSADPSQQDAVPAAAEADTDAGAGAVAVVSGELVVGGSGDCITLRSADGELVAVAWPTGWTQPVRDDGTGEPHGELFDADGEFAANTHGVWIQGTGVIAEAVDSCGVAGPTFVVARIDSVAVQGGETAGAGGLLVVGGSGDCLTLQGTGGVPVQVAWPPGWAQVVHGDGTGELRDGDGVLVATTGDVIQGSGGSHEATDSCGRAGGTFLFNGLRVDPLATAWQGPDVDLDGVESGRGLLVVGESGDCITVQSLGGDRLVFNVAWPDGWTQVVREDGFGELRDADGNLVATTGNVVDGPGAGADGPDSCGNDAPTFRFSDLTMPYRTE